MTFTLTYVSVSRIPESQSIAAVNEIVATSRKRNEADGITGALIFTGTDFAQTLEGPEEAVLTLMDRIRADPRHTDIEVVHEASKNLRMFQDWSMAYSGLTSFVRRQVEATRSRASAQYGYDVASSELRNLMLNFARQVR